MLKDDVSLMLSKVAPVAFQAFGERAQIIKALEELSELMQVLCKRLNGSPVSEDDTIDEIADVLIMAGQLRFLYGADLVDQRMMYKLERTAKFIMSMKKPNENL